jgi:hypothetical protein
MDLTDALAVRSPGDGTVTAGAAGEAVGPYLLPPAFARTLTARIAHRDSVRLGELPAYRYRDLRAGGARLTVYAASTTAAPELVVCARVPARDCDTVAASLTTAATPRPLGADKAYAKRLGAVIGKLRKGRNAAQRALAKARTRKAQQRAATRVASAYRAAAAGLGGLHAGAWERGVQELLVTRLDIAVAAYRALAAAAGNGAAARYATARGRASAADGKVRSAIATYGYLGYKVG